MASWRCSECGEMCNNFSPHTCYSDYEAIKKALRRLVIAARTSGGVAGPDAGLMAACAEAEALLTPDSASPSQEQT